MVSISALIVVSHRAECGLLVLDDFRIIAAGRSGRPVS
jgi:hypothetical protein